MTPLAMIAGAIVGWLAAVFALSNILLPLFWAWPKAKMLAARGQLERPIPPIRFLAAPIIWSVALTLVTLVSVSILPPFGGGFLIGLIAGSPSIFQLIRKPNRSMEEDFTATYGGFLKTSVLDRQVAALMRMTMNLFEVTTTNRADHAPLVLRLDARRARLRYLGFCFATAGYFADVPTPEEHNILFQQAMGKLLESVMSYRGEGAIVQAGESVESVAAELNGAFGETIDQWRKYMTTLQSLVASGQKGSHPDKTTIVCSMLRHLEGGDFKQADAQRLWPLAQWIEGTIGSIGGSFNQLISAE
jgi:hypothetical protein